MRGTRQTLVGTRPGIFRVNLKAFQVYPGFNEKRAKRSRARSLLALTATSERRTAARPTRPGTTVMAASRPTIAPDEDIAALLERAQVSAPISDKVVPQLLAQDVSSVAN